MPKQYLGDAVYAEIDELGRLVLTTEDGIEATNTIYLEPEVIDALLGYIGLMNRGTDNRPASPHEAIVNAWAAMDRHRREKASKGPVLPAR